MRYNIRGSDFETTNHKLGFYKIINVIAEIIIIAMK